MPTALSEEASSGSSGKTGQADGEIEKDVLPDSFTVSAMTCSVAIEGR